MTKKELRYGSEEGTVEWWLRNGPFFGVTYKTEKRMINKTDKVYCRTIWKKNA